MDKFISHFSAADYWKIPNIDAVLGPGFAKPDQVEYTVTSRKQRYQKKGHIVHLCTAHIPEDAVILKDGQLVASPELVFLQLAPKLNMHQLILLGFQLCSRPWDSPGEALTTKKKLSDFLNKTPWHRGHRKALRAVKYIADGSASITESQAFMVLTLPHALGGYGLKGADLNQVVVLNDEAREQLNQKRCYVDILYNYEKVAVEYDSFKHHRASEQQERDALRSQILVKHGLKVMHMYATQLYNFYSCKNFAFNLASQLKRRIQNRAKKFVEMHNQFRLLLCTRGTSLSPTT